jgi:hypothetical protein
LNQFVLKFPTTGRADHLSKVHANASRHSALSYGHAEKLEAQLLAEVKELLARAESADTQALPEGLDIPAELARREARLRAISRSLRGLYSPVRRVEDRPLRRRYRPVLRFAQSPGLRAGGHHAAGLAGTFSSALPGLQRG